MSESVSISIVLLPNSWKKNGTNYYKIRVSLGRKSKYIKTNVLVHREDIDKNDQPRDPGRRRILEDLQRNVEDIICRIDTFQLPRMTLDDVIRFVNKEVHGEEFSLDLFTFAEQAIASKPVHTASVYKSAIKSISNYTGKTELDIREITSSFLRSWEGYLRKEYGDKGRAVSAYTAALRHIHFLAQRQFNNEELSEIRIKNPFQYYHPPQQRQAKHRAVDQSVLEKMYVLRESLSGRERIGVDVFLISFALMGMNSPDLYDCAAPTDGVITYNRTKTRGKRADEALMKVRLEPFLQSIAGDYLTPGGPYCFDFRQRYTTYTILGENVNDGLASFARRIGYEGRLTLYSARHTWATIAYKIGIDKGVINDCLCHVDRSMKITDIYIDKVWDVMWEANRKVLDYLFS